MKKRISVMFTVILAVLFIVSGCAGAPAASEAGAPAASTAAGQSAAAPAAGNKIVIYTSMYENVIAIVSAELKEQFPNVDIQFVYDGTGRLQMRVEAEEAAGRLGCDMLMVADPSWSIELKEKGMLHPYAVTSAANLAFEYDTEGYWYPVRISNMVLAYNPTFTPQGAPASFQDFAYNASLKGGIAMTNPLVSGTTQAAVSALQAKYGAEYFDALAAQNITIETASVALTRLEQGEFKALMVLEESVLRRQLQGSSIEIIYPSDGIVMIPSTIMTVANDWSANRNTARAEEITEWFLSDEGQNAIVDGYMHSVLKNFDRIPQGSMPTSQIHATSLPIDWETSYRQRDAIQLRFQQALALRQQ